MELLIIPNFAFLNRLRGGGWFAKKIKPFVLNYIAKHIKNDFVYFVASKFLARVLYLVTLCVFCIACTVLNWQDAFVFSAAYFAWAVYAWGRWFDLGNMPEPTRPIKPLERIIEHVSFGSDYVAMTWRMAFASPFLVYFGWGYALIFPLACVAIYALSWQLWRENPIPKAELIVGVLWGIILIHVAR